MKMRIAFVRVLMLSTAVGMLVACGLDMPKEKQTSFETLTVKKEDITTLLKFSAKMKGQSDVTITPQVSGLSLDSTSLANIAELTIINAKYFDISNYLHKFAPLFREIGISSLRI